MMENELQESALRFIVGLSELTQAHEGMKAGENDAGKQQIVQILGHAKTEDDIQVILSQCTFPFGGHEATEFAHASQGVGDKQSIRISQTCGK